MRAVMRVPGGIFVPNLALNRDLRQSGQLDGALRSFAHAIALRAREIAVRGAFEFGDYQASIHAEVGDKPGPVMRGRTGRIRYSNVARAESAALAQQERQTVGTRVGRVVATDFKAHWIEWGYQVNSHKQPTGVIVPGKRVLRRAVRGTGLRYQAPRHRRQSKHVRPE